MKKYYFVVIFIFCLLFYGRTLFPSNPAAHHNSYEKIKKVTGKIILIDTVENKFVLMETTGDDTYIIDRNTKIIINGKYYKFPDLKIGEKVTVHYKVKGISNIAVEIK